MIWVFLAIVSFFSGVFGSSLAILRRFGRDLSSNTTGHLLKDELECNQFIKLLDTWLS